MRYQTYALQHSRGLLLLSLAAAAALLLAACQRPAFLRPKLPDDGPPIATSQEAALRFAEKVTQAGKTGAQTGNSTLTVTDVEVTSFLNIIGLLC